jgi:hypothetical protein
MKFYAMHTDFMTNVHIIKDKLTLLNARFSAIYVHINFSFNKKLMPSAQCEASIFVTAT